MNAHFFLPAVLTAAAATPAALSAQSGLEWARYLGGSGVEDAAASHLIARANNGDMFVAGMTASPSFPATVTHGPTGGTDAFAARLDRDGQLLWAVRLGGSTDDSVRGLFYDAATGRLFVGGHTDATDFPTTAGAWQASNAGQIDAFLAILDTTDPALQLVYSSYIGGPGRDTLPGIQAQPGSPLVYLAMSSTSTNMPVTPNAYDPTSNGDYDAVILVLDTSATGPGAVLSASYVGSDGADFVRRMDLDANGIVTVQGRTVAPGATPFPTVQAWQPAFGGGTYDHFVFRFDPWQTGAAQLVWSTYFGGTGNEDAFGLSVADDGIVTLAGMTSSPNLPMGAPQPAFAGVYDGFIARLDPSSPPANQLVWGTYFGGPAHEAFADVRCDEDGVVVVAGVSEGPAAPTTPGAFATSYTGLRPMGYFARIDSRSGQVEYASYFAPGTLIYGVEPDGRGGVFAVGSTDSSTLPVTHGPGYGGQDDLWVGRLSLLPDGITNVGEPSPACARGTYATVDGFPGAGNAGFELLARDVPTAAASQTVGVLLVDFAVQPFPIPVLGIDLYVLPQATLVLGGNTGSEVRVPVPLTGISVGASVACQFAWVDAGSCSSMLSASQALTITVR